jgi:hypothetical protein
MTEGHITKTPAVAKAIDSAYVCLPAMWADFGTTRWHGRQREELSLFSVVHHI